MYRLPEHTKEWFRAGVAALDVHLLNGQGPQSKPVEADTTDEKAVAIFQFEHPRALPGFEFKKEQTKHRVEVADIMSTTELSTLVRDTPGCRGAVVHISEGSPAEPFESNQLKTMFRHICMFCEDYMTILVILFCFESSNDMFRHIFFFAL